MRVSVMRLIDKWVGVPICAGLSLIRRLSWEDTKGAGPLRIAFVKLAEQGSTVLAYSAIRRAVEMAGRENVYFVVFEENRFILDVLGLIPPENVIEIRSKGGAAAMGTDVLRAIRRMRKLGINTVVDMEFFARSTAMISYLSGAERRIGFHSFGGEGPYRGDLFTHRLRFNPHIHTAQTFRMMVEAIGAEADKLPTFNMKPPAADEERPRFEASGKDVEEARDIVRRCAGGKDVKGLVLMNANCSDLLPLRRWPSERYVEVAKRLVERYPEIYAAFTGGPAEAEAVAKVAEQVGSERCFSLAGETSLRQLLVIYGLADVLLTNDSGPAHFAALTGIDVVTLFGPECPMLFAARTAREHIMWDGIVCSPCVSALNNRTSPCQNNYCMQNITTEQVFKEICNIYERRKCS